MKKNKIPVYSLDTFKNQFAKKASYQVEVFDHNRHYKVDYPHRHDFFYEVLYIKQGSGTYHIDFHEYEISPESIFFVSPGQVHEITFSEDIYGYIFFLNTDEFLPIDRNETFYWLFDQLNYKIDSSRMEILHHQKLEWLFKDAIENYLAEDKYTDSICKNNLSSILLYCSRLYENVNPILSKKGKGFELIRNFKDLISKHYIDNLSVSQYAEKLSITPNHLNETTKQLTGLNANSLINNKVLVEVKRLLAYTEDDITGISYKFNFKDQSYFSRFFKGKTGMSPKDFRNLHNKAK